MRCLPTTSSIGTDEMSGGAKATIRLNSPLMQQLDRLAAESRREHAVEAGRRPAALQVAEHDRPRLLAGQFLERRRDAVAGAAQALGAAEAAAWMSEVLPPIGLAPSATTMIEKYAPQASRSLICCATFVMS